MKRLRLTLIFLFAALFLHAVAAGQSKASAATILSSLRSRMASAPAVEAVFTINGGQGPVQGSVILSGAKYSMTTPQMSVWYDGRTQWTFLRNTNEVSITETSADELLSTNPFAILSDQTGHYTARRLSDNSGRYRVELVPRDKSSIIKRYVLFIDHTDSWPRALTVEFDDNRRIEVVIENIGASAVRDAATFAFDAHKHPAAEIIDLR